MREQGEHGTGEAASAPEYAAGNDFEDLAMRNLMLEKRIRRLEALIKSKSNRKGGSGLFSAGDGVP